MHCSILFHPSSEAVIECWLLTEANQLFRDSMCRLHLDAPFTHRSTQPSLCSSWTPLLKANRCFSVSQTMPRWSSAFVSASHSRESSVWTSQRHLQMWHLLTFTSSRQTPKVYLRREIAGWQKVSTPFKEQLQFPLYQMGCIPWLFRFKYILYSKLIDVCWPKKYSLQKCD